MNVVADKKQDHGAIARSKLKSLGSPKEIQQRNLHTVLTWLYRWGYSTADIISDLLGRINRSHARRMAEDDWIRAVSVKGYPTYYVLTEKGLGEAIRHSANLLEYKEIDPYRVDLSKLHHYLIAQIETVAVLKGDRFYDYKTMRMFDFVGDNAPKKIPDIIFLEDGINNTNGKLEVFEKPIAIEIELTPKWNHHFDMFVTNIVDDLQSCRFAMFIIISDSKAILQRYEEGFRPGRTVKIWSNSGRGKIVDTGKTLTLPDWTTKHIVFRQVGSTAPYPISPW